LQGCLTRHSEVLFESKQYQLLGMHEPRRRAMDSLYSRANQEHRLNVNRL
jgi:hypothetical protein